MGDFGLDDLLWCPLDDDFAAPLSAFGTEIDDEIGALDHIEVVFDNDNGVTVFDQSLESLEEDGNIVLMESYSWFVEEVEDLFFFLVDEMVGELDPLEFPPGEGCCRLAEFDIAQADIHKRGQFLQYLRMSGKEFEGFGHAQLEDVIYVFAVVPDLENIALKSLSFAGFASQDYVGEKLHLHDLLTGALAFLTTSSGSVERKITGFEAHGLGFSCPTQHLPDLIHGFGVGGRDGTGRSADGGLVDHDDPVSRLFSLDFFKPVRNFTLPAFVKDIVEERAFS